MGVRAEPAVPERALVQRALDAVYGVDVNPFAVAVARFRLLIAALQASGIKRLKDAPGFRINVAVGDSLLHGRRFDQLDMWDQPRLTGGVRALAMPIAWRISTELIALSANSTTPWWAIHRISLSRIVPSIGPTATASRPVTRNTRSRAVHRAVFELAIYGHDVQPAGYVGMITANSFMKREFGKKLIEDSSHESN